jgi:CBS domain-containing protein
MLKLADIMTTRVIALEPETTLRDAIDELSAAGVSGAPVVSGGQLLGVVSASDILDFQASSPTVPSYREDLAEWGDWGPPDRWEEDLSEPPSAYFVQRWADSGADLVERMAGPDGPEWDLLGEHAVAEVMTRAVVSLSSDVDVAEAARVMMERGIHRLIVADDHRLVGIVSTMDVLRAVADGRLKA